MGLVKKELLYPEGLSVTIARSKDDPYFSIFDPENTSIEVPEGFEAVMFLVPDGKSAMRLASKLQSIVIALKHEATKATK